MASEIEQGEKIEPLIERYEKKTRTPVFLKVFASLLLVAFSYHLFSGSFPGGSGGSAAADGVPSRQERCDLFKGKWVPNPSRPSYTNSSCNLIGSYQNCLKNGKPDKGYLHWRWQPDGCPLPRFNAQKFLHDMRNKSWAFIGDSILRNHIESVLCSLSEVSTEPIEVFHDLDFQSRTWYYPSYNLTMSLIWAPFLVKYEHGDSKTDNIKIHLDVLDVNWSDVYHHHDYIVMSGGQWFYKSFTTFEGGRATSCHGCLDKTLHEVGVSEPYRRALDSTFRFILSSAHKPIILFRTWTPSHFEHGRWDTGGVCERTEPYEEGEVVGDPTDIAMRDVEVTEVRRAAAAAAETGLRIGLLDTYHLSLLRPDGHPGPYRTLDPFKGGAKKVQQDCLHWCLPGPIDAWTDLVWEMLQE